MTAESGSDSESAAPTDAIEADLRRVHEELGPCDIVMADIEDGTPDDRVMAFDRIARGVLE